MLSSCRCACVSVLVTLKQQAPYCPSSVYGNYGFCTFSAQEASRPDSIRKVQMLYWGTAALVKKKTTFVSKHVCVFLFLYKG